ncbi:hypothetical protein CDD81_3105 [Ophiocordyceps australis]|uniref:Uncharacterized protein n=1 Tax=Ophiocordyceps australis TaxID=1399860 RepID=A0A2C5YC04_9HYPO|nr:hypothetical protein CDD81_3105 [Ophiocordyceps australis]
MPPLATCLEAGNVAFAQHESSLLSVISLKPSQQWTSNCQRLMIGVDMEFGQVSTPRVVYNKIQVDLFKM